MGGEFPLGVTQWYLDVMLLMKLDRAVKKNIVFLEPKTSDDIIDHATLNMPFYFVFLMFVGKEIHLEICCRLKP